MIDRPHVELVCPAALTLAALTVPFSAADLPGRSLVGDLRAGDGAALLELPAAWQGRSSDSPFELATIHVAAGLPRVGSGRGAGG